MDALMAILIGVVVFLIMGLLVFVKEFFKFKTDGKVLVRCLNRFDEEEDYLVKVDGLITQPNKKNRSYVVKPKQKLHRVEDENGKTYFVPYDDTEIGKKKTVQITNPDTGEERQIKVTVKGVEYAGSCHDVKYPQGLFLSMQVKIKCIDVNEGNPNAINRYGSKDALNITDDEIGAIKSEQFSQVVVQTSKDFGDLLDKFKSLIKEKISPVIVYIMLAVCILGIGGCIYLIYTLPAKIWGG